MPYVQAHTAIVILQLNKREVPSFQRQMLACFLPSPSKNERQRQSEKVYLDSPRLATRSLKGAGQVADDLHELCNAARWQCKLIHSNGRKVFCIRPALYKRGLKQLPENRREESTGSSPGAPGNAITRASGCGVPIWSSVQGFYAPIVQW